MNTSATVEIDKTTMDLKVNANAGTVEKNFNGHNNCVNVNVDEKKENDMNDNNNVEQNLDVNVAENTENIDKKENGVEKNSDANENIENNESNTDDANLDNIFNASLEEENCDHNDVSAEKVLNDNDGKRNYVDVCDVRANVEENVDEGALENGLKIKRNDDGDDNVEKKRRLD